MISHNNETFNFKKERVGSTPVQEIIKVNIKHKPFGKQKLSVSSMKGFCMNSILYWGVAVGDVIFSGFFGSLANVY